ncbi:N,N-dimethylformamidase beta subunit family domain-containing protein [Kitasatospora sp. NPDC001683]
MAEASRRGILGLGLMAAAVTSCGARHPDPAARPTPDGQGTPGTAGPTGAQHSGLKGDAPDEQSLPGNADWEITDPGRPGAVEAFADRVSVPPGESFGLHVSTPAAAFTVSAYRMGWYGGARARLVWRREHVPGAEQAAPHVDQATRTVLTGWQRTLAVDTAGWPEGAYLLRLDAEDGSGRSYVPLTVRSASTAGRTVVMSAPATWQAYNEWGGYSLYNGPTGTLATRSLRVVFDRPYDYDHGAGLFLVYEAPLIALAEKLGLPLAYTTGIDVARDPGLLHGAVAVLSLGHDEYWSPEQRANVVAARDAGANLAILGANCCFRRIRFEPTELGPDRTVVCYKDAWAQDPGHQSGAPATTDFRVGPGADPESSMLGVIYDGYPVDAPYVVTSPGHWAFEGTGVAAGASFPHLVGVEYDRVDTAFPTPRPIEVIAHSPVVCEGRRSHSDTAYYTVPSGAGVFATGTMRWVETLDAHGPGGGKADHGIDSHAGDLVRKVTENVLRAFAAGPAGHTHPAQDNLATVYGTA